jgi:hypothetical protein
VLIPDEEKRAEFVEVLKYKEGKLGRVLTKKISGLPAGSRLEPSPNLPDVADFEVAPCPFQARFFVGSDRSRWLHNCPLFEVIPNFALDSWGIDLLHTWCLGPLAGFVGLCLKTFLESRAFLREARGLPAKDAAKVGLGRVKEAMFAFFRDQKKVLSAKTGAQSYGI